MNSFSIRDSLLKLKERNYDLKINNTIDLLIEKFNEDELKILIARGLKIDNNIIRLYFLDNVGFRCFNEKQEHYGKLPICLNIEKLLNNEYLEFIKKI